MQCRQYNATYDEGRLPLEEAAKLSAQLPMVMKGMYFDQYDPTDRSVKLRAREDLLTYLPSTSRGCQRDSVRDWQQDKSGIYGEVQP